MSLYRLNAFIHLFSTVLLTGLALFWVIMAAALKQRFHAERTAELLGILNRARWPHVVVPYSLRLPLPLVSWGLLAVLALTGVLGFNWRNPDGVAQIATLQWLKLAGVAMLLIVQALLTRRPSPVAIHANFVLVLGVALISVWMI